MSSIPLDSGENLTDVEHHFRVTAGPGAGKTYWLANHIRHVVRVSHRLTPASRIAVISYTNVAVKELVGRIETAAQAADISTIHSFLFRNLVRPYLHLMHSIDDANIIAHADVTTHDEHYPSRTHLDTWLRDLGKGRLLRSGEARKLSNLKECLQALDICINESDEPYFASCKTAWTPEIQQLLTPENILAYKRKYWETGTIDHEDVLYFAYQLLHKCPVLRQFLSDKFPYLFIDEFQDTTPIQSALVKWLADSGTIVGVIGDPAQSIFSFVGASSEHFRDFRLSTHGSYVIDGNRRSTHVIVKLLNNVRQDGLEQKPLRKNVGLQLTLYSGGLPEALKHARDNSVHADNFLVLARSNKEVFRARCADSGFVEDPWKTISKVDTDRYRFLQKLLESVDLAKRGFFDSSIRRLVRGISTRNKFRLPLEYPHEVTTLFRRSLALSLLEFMVKNEVELADLTCLDAFLLVRDFIVGSFEDLKLPKPTRGKFFDAASTIRYSDLLASIKTTEETRTTRTIHQAKGCEADAVFVILDEGSADHILNPVADDEEHQITYVALSRAKNELFVYCPAENRGAEFVALAFNHVETMPESTNTGS